MTVATERLLNTMRRPRRSVWLSRFRIIHRLLVREYGVPSLGNYRDPVKEIVYIVLSAKTTEVLYRRASRQLWASFPSARAVAAAPIDDLVTCIGNAGLGNKRGLQLKRICSRLCTDMGPRPARRFRRMSLQEAYDYLISLPGVGPKSALCVLMYSLDHDVFPVDANIHRMARRLGALPAGLKHYKAQQILPAKIPCGIAKELHIGMVLHGRKVCRPRNPDCVRCVVRCHCRQFARWRKGKEV